MAFEDHSDGRPCDPEFSGQRLRNRPGQASQLPSLALEVPTISNPVDPNLCQPSFPGPGSSNTSSTPIAVWHVLPA